MTNDNTNDNTNIIDKIIEEDEELQDDIARQELELEAQEQLWKTYRERYSNKNLWCSLCEYRNNLTPRYPSGLSTLDELLGGRDDNKVGYGFSAGLAVLGGNTSTGKTSLALQIACNVAKSAKGQTNDRNDERTGRGQEVLYFSLEMNRRELQNKILCSESARQGLLLTTKDYLAYRENDAKLAILRGGEEVKSKDIKELVKNEGINAIYADLEAWTSRLYIFSWENINRGSRGEITLEAIEQRIEEYIELTGGKPFVVIDYLQIIKPIITKETRYLTEKQILDRTVTELKRFSCDNDIPILLISAYNRSSNEKGESKLTSNSGSGGIEYTADVLLGLEIDTSENTQEEERDKTVRKLRLKLQKNRNGETMNRGIDLYFYTRYGVFQEQDNYIY